MLDEATSALDVVTEAAVQKALNQAMKGRTTFVIAHRMSTVRNADKIFVMKQGRIVEQGSYDDLMSSDSEFSSFVSQNLIADQ